MRAYHLTEEIARWAFEVLCREGEKWDIVFTNPTAGPWKTIKATNNSGVLGEVYRFSLEENRPDIVMVNDEEKLVVIIEAKDSLSKLVSETQDTKSIEVVDSLAKTFKSLKSNEYWGGRADYVIICGLLWGSEGGESESDIATVMDKYHDDASECEFFFVDAILGIEANKASSGAITCKLFTKQYGTEMSFELSRIAESFNYALVSL